MLDGLVPNAEPREYRGRIVPSRRLADLQDSILKAHREGLIDEGLYQERLTNSVGAPPPDLQARSLIIVAFRDPPVRFTFWWRGGAVSLAVPPTYLHWRQKDLQVEGLVADALGRQGFRVAPAVLPKKALAVGSGLAAYGKNNITYVDGMGSFHRLAAFYSDVPCDQDEWSGPRMMARCEKCLGCERSCPTGAIDPTRFLLRAERCTTFWNEKPGQVTFPPWMDPSWHNCLIGCMRCQLACPENRAVRDWYDQGAEFNHEETLQILDGTPLAELPASLAEKLARWDLVEWLEVLPRNLGAVLRAKD